MSIEEKPQLLEFSCILDSMKDITWNIKYEPTGEHNLHIEGNGQYFNCPVELFKDVTAYLQSKKIIEPDVNVRGRTVPTPGFTPGGFAESLLPPTIEGSDNINTSVASVKSGSPMDALSSFDITDEASNLTQPKVENTAVNNVVVENSNTFVQPSIQVGENKVTSETKSEIPNRPVIRTRVSGDDPQSAEKEAEILRGTGAAGEAKKIKKKHKITE